MRDTFVLDRLPPPEAQPEYIFGLPELTYPDRLNAAVALIDSHASNGVALVNDNGQWTYGDMQRLSNRIALLLVEQEGLVPGNRVLLRGSNGAMLFAAWLGVLKAGGIVVTTMPMLRAGEIAAILDKAEISHAIVDDRTLDDFAAACGLARFAPSILTYHGDAGGGAMEANLADLPDDFVAADTGRDDPALIAFTSGTTGEPKGCVQFHRDILIVADTFGRHLVQPQPGDRLACSAPIAFTFGLGALVIFPWRFGATSVTVETGAPARLLEALSRHRISTLFTAPTAYKAMLPLIGEHDISALHTCVSAGEHLPDAIWTAWHRATGLRIINGLGATEMMHIFISAAGDAIRPGATGRAVPGYTACVLDDDGRAVTEGTGRLAAKGPTGCRYLADDRQAKYVQGGWNVTGDTYRVDAEGYFWYVARSDDMIVSSGYNIAAPEVENALLGHAAVAECAVVGSPCSERGMMVKAYVVACMTVDAKTLQDHVKAVIAPYKYPREIVFVDVLPKTLTGKLQRFALRAS